MAKRRGTGGLTELERVGGGVLFLAFYPLFPLLAEPLRRAAGELLGQRVSDGLFASMYYYLFFAAAAAVFHSLLSRSTRRFLDSPSETLKTAGMGLIGYYGLDRLFAQLSGMLLDLPENVNDAAAFTQAGSAPHSLLLCVAFLAPFAEETLFRGWVFGGLKERSRPAAYGVSCLLFALVHVWRPALELRDPAYLLMTVQYLAPGLALAWAYDHSGTLWASIGLHAGVNALSVLGGTV